MTDGMNSEATGRERGIERIFQLFAFLHDRREPIRVAELPKAINAPRSTTYTLVKMLTNAGLLESIDGGSTVFFGKLMHLYGQDYVQQNDIVRRGGEIVARLAKETGETCELCMLHRDRQAIVHTSHGSRPFRFSSEVGARIPIPWTASGRFLLSHLTEKEIAELLKPVDFVLPDGRATTLDDFLRDCREAQRVGICMTKGLITAFTQCLAAPIRRSGRVVATLCFVVPIDVEGDRIEQLKATLIKEAAVLSLPN
jgi:DNA-binding IclR family transcriptional regulator